MGLPALARDGISGDVKPSIAVAIAVAATLALVAGCPGNPAGDTTEGREVFAKVCATCHGPTGHPPPEMIARLGVKDLTSPALRDRITPALVETQVRNGSPNGLMPPLGPSLNEMQIKAVAAFVASKAFLDAGSGSAAH